MRSLLITFLCLGFVVMLLGMAERSFQVSQWSSLVARAQETGVLENKQFERRLHELPHSPFTLAITGAGFAICVLAIWRLIKETRPKNPPI
jgi:hypothetical protein